MAMELTDELVQRAVVSIRRPWWKSADPLLLSMLLESSAERNTRIVRFGIIAAALANALFCFLDKILLPDVADTLIAVRLGVGILFIALIEIAVRTKLPLSVLHAIAATGIVVAAIGWLIPALGTSHQFVLAQFMVFGTIFVLGANLFFNFRFWLSALASTIVTIAFVYGLNVSLDIDLVARAILSLFFITLMALSLYLSWQLSMERYNAFLHSLQAQFQEKLAIEKGEQLEKIADTDPLTGLRNRRAISQDFLNLARDGLAENEQIGLILIDVDYFKRFNDTLGHHAGDECLIELARVFTETAAAFGATVGRHGGEEFVILAKVTSEAHLTELTRALCDGVEALAISHPARGDDRHIVTISAGATMTRNDGSMELTVLLQQADRALYSSKFTGRATFTIYDPKEAARDASGENLAELLRHAISRGLVSVVYQPFIDTRTNQVIGHETLMRLRDFDGSVISPAVFIPVAEQTGAIIELGRWAIEQACQDLATHSLGDVISVNVSAIQLKTAGFPQQVAEIVTAYGLAPRKLALEVTEGIDIVMDTQAQKNIEQLRSFGVQIWLDDFGTGFAGLAWLRRFDFDVVKIDRAFLNDCETLRGSAMLHDIVRLLRNRSIHVLVEGVETKQQVELLKRLAVDTMQGFYLGRPVPLEMAASFKG